MEMYDDYGQPDMFSQMTNPEHALQSPNALLLSTGQNVFMYEHDRSTVPIKQESKMAGGQLSENIFEFPNAEEMAELGCSPVDSCWPETPLLAGSLDGSLNDSGTYFGWDLSEDEQEGLFRTTLTEPFCSAPTLAELNMEDSQSKDNCLSLKRKHDSGSEEKKASNPNISKLLAGQQEMSLSPQSWKRVKTEALEMAKGETPNSSHPLLRTPSIKPNVTKKLSRTKAPKQSASKVKRTHGLGENGKNLPKAKKPSKLSLSNLHPSEIDFTELFWKRYRSESIPSPSKGMSRSEFIARTPNPFGNRRFLGRNALLKTKKIHSPSPSKVVATPTKLPKSVQEKIPHHKSKSRTRTATGAQETKLTAMTSVANGDENTQDKLWKDLEEFMYGEQAKATSESKKDLPHRTLVLPEPELKSEKSKSPRIDPGFDSHDEGLGSENEDHDDYVTDDDDDDEDDDDHLPDDGSDMSDDPGLPSTSTKSHGKVSPSGRSLRRRRKVKTRRSEYDDFTPNPRKLLHIGHELNKLNMTISSLSPGNEASMDEKNHTRREKNKLASRACRLKKKAQHEANKVKLWGLVEEAKQLKGVLKAMRSEISSRTTKPKASWDCSIGAKLDHLIKTSLGHMVAGHTSEFVNSVLEKTAKGIPITGPAMSQTRGSKPGAQGGT